MSDKVVSTTLLARGVGQYQSKMAAASAANARFGASAAMPSARAATMQSRMKGLAGSAGLISPTLLGVGGAVYAIKSVVGAAAEWESAFTGVEKTVEGTDSQLARISDGLRDLSGEIPVTAEELAGIAESAGQLGIQTDTVLDFTRVMADLGVATDMSSEQAATALARIANITQMSQGDFDRLGATVVDLGNNLATTESEIVEMSLRLAGAGNQAGLTEAEILGLSGALSSVGIRAEAGGTAFSKVMIQISEAASEGGEELDKLAEVAGMSSDAFAELFAEDPAEAIIRFVEGLGGAASAGENLFGILGDLGIEEQRMRDALLRTAGAGDVVRDSIERGNAAWSENIALTEEAERRYETTASQWQMFENNVKDVARTVGEDLLPVVEAALGVMNDLAGFNVDDAGRNLTSSDSAGGFLRDLFGFNIAQGLDDFFVLTGALEESQTAAGQAAKSAADYDAAMRGLGATGERYAGQAEAYKQGLQEQFDASTKAAEGIETHATEMGRLIAEFDTASEAIDEYNNRTRAQFDPVFKVAQATEGLAQAQENVQKIMEDSESTQADRQQALRDEAGAAVDLDGSLRELWAAMEDGSLSTATLDEKLEFLQSEFGLSREAAQLMVSDLDKYADRAESLPDIEIRTSGVAQARAELQELSGYFGTHYVNLQIRTTGGRTARSLAADAARYAGQAEGRAAGGPVSAGSPYIVGEDGPEAFVPAVSGSIIPHEQTRSMLSGGHRQRITVEIPVSLDGRKIAQSSAFMDELGNVQAKQARLTAT